MTHGLRESLEWWLDAVALKSESVRTRQTYAQVAGAFVHHAESQGVRTLDAVTPALVRQYLAAMKARGCSLHTVRQAHRTLKAWWNWCVREELLASNPIRKVEPPSATVQPRWTPSMAELRRLVAAAKACPRDYAMLLVLADTGMRIGECIQLTVGDARRDRALVRGKGGRYRLVFFSPRTRAALRRYVSSLGGGLADDEPLWRALRTGEPLTLYGALQALERLGKRALGRGLGAHALRRAFATHALRQGVHPETLRRLMGHSNIAILKHYAALDESDLQRAHRAVTPLREL